MGWVLVVSKVVLVGEGGLFFLISVVWEGGVIFGVVEVVVCWVGVVSRVVGLVKDIVGW